MRHSASMILDRFPRQIPGSIVEMSPLFLTSVAFHNMKEYKIIRIAQQHRPGFSISGNTWRHWNKYIQTEQV